MMKIDMRILKFLYSKKNDGEFYDVNRLVKHNLYKYEIDKIVVEMEENQLVTRGVKGYLTSAAITEQANGKHANNRICKTTLYGINYTEEYLGTSKDYLLTIVDLIIHLMSVIMRVSI